jgi:hypothetical protein
MASPEAWLCAAVDSATNIATYPLFAPEGAALPYVVYQRSATERPKTLSGANGIPSASFSVSIYGDGYAAVKDLADVIRSAIDDFNGTAGGLTISGVDITDERDGDPIFVEGRDLAVYVVEQSYTIFWEE